MAKLRHLALSVDDVEETAEFYKSVFDMHETKREGTRVWLSDGVVSVAILDAKKHTNAAGGPKGLNHVGFAVDDIDETIGRVLSYGGRPHETIAGEDRGASRQLKLKDPSGVYVEVVNGQHVHDQWYLPV